MEKGYLASTPELNVQAIKDIKYMPAVSKARSDILQVAKEMKAADFLSPNTDPEELAKRAWLDLEGVTDEWIQERGGRKDRRWRGSADDGPCRPGRDARQPKRAAANMAVAARWNTSCKLTGDWAFIKPIVWEPGQEELGDDQTCPAKSLSFRSRKTVQ